MTAQSLNADRPSTDPANDLFGHAPFAKTLAKAITGYSLPDGIVLSLHGPWGSGKSTVLAYVQHEVEQLPEDERPVVVTFNPWWFSGQDNLAKAFLGQLEAVLPGKHKGFKAVGEKLGEFSGALGRLADLAGASIGMPGGGIAVEAAAKLLLQKPKDVPALKQALSDLLREEKKRVLVIIDDIDRLAPDEVRQLFTVIKALADFPYVTYLLAFDRDVASSAIAQQTGLPGERYLEKIVQVPFELPYPDRAALYQALFNRLDLILETLPAGRFDNDYWHSVFYAGLSALFRVPRDVVRATNALSVTFPAVVGEVNPVDFIAIECLRIFLPQVYDAVRASPELFTGYAQDEEIHNKQEVLSLHADWLSKVPERLRERTQDLMRELFPRLDSLWGGPMHTRDDLYSWRRELRMCSPDIFPVYFRLSLSGGAVSRADLDALLAQARNPVAFAELLRSSVRQKRSDGTTKARALLERLMDHVPSELEAAHAESVIPALMQVGDELLASSDKGRGIFDFGNESRVSRVAYHLLAKVSTPQRLPLLKEAMSNVQALRCSQYLLVSLTKEAERAAKGAGDSLLRADDVALLRDVWVKRIGELAASTDLLEHPALGALLPGWRLWGGEAYVSAWWKAAATSDDGLLKLISVHATESTSNLLGSSHVSVHLRVNPKVIQRYGDVKAVAERVRGLLAAGKVQSVFLPASERFILEFDRWQAGEDPDADEFDD